MTTFSLLVVQPDQECPMERFGPWLREVGATIRLVRTFLGEPVPRVVEEDGLLVLGGDMSAWDDEEHPWLADVRELLRRATDMSVPTLGICLGGQLLAAATGGTVGRGDAGMEVGVVEVLPCEDAANDELMTGLSWPLLQGSMHRDAITTLPPGSTWLARSDAYRHQAFRIGLCAWGVQFHPELSPKRYRRWAEYVREDELTTRAIADGIEQFDQLDSQVQIGAQALAHRFAEVVRSHTDQHGARSA